jgi:hypothetical protein
MDNVIMQSLKCNDTHCGGQRTSTMAAATAAIVDVFRQDIILDCFNETVVGENGDPEV